MTDSKFELKKKSFTQLRDEFLAGNYDESWEEHNLAMNELHNKLEDVSDLVPLLESGSKHCQYVAAYIAAQEGNGAASIFPYVFPLINSAWSEVRDEACDCFLNCTEDPAHYLALLKLLEDVEQSIRLRVITIIFGLSDKVIEGIYKLTKNVDSLADIGLGMRILMEGYEQSLAQEFIQFNNFENNKASVVCTYVAAYKHLGDSPEFKSTMNRLGESDISKHYHIYFEEE
ncbi:hypothetical protein [Bowmanella denitrificans]|uniref:hypothetical protein n=1 Tax=Bowmanella denitrificans TaxID=366582 RepID=UPI000C9CD317|nr:hypothetical protein [Bowmanella denitrificans]